MHILSSSRGSPVKFRRGPAAVYPTSSSYHRKFREGVNEDDGSQKTLKRRNGLTPARVRVGFPWNYSTASGRPGRMIFPFGFFIECEWTGAGALEQGLFFFGGDGMNETTEHVPAAKHDRDLSPSEIEKKSFRILEELLGDFESPFGIREVIKRVAHATTDVEWAKTFRFSPGAVDSGIEAIRRGAPIVTDVEMVRAGIRRSALERSGSKVFCFLNDSDVAERAKAEGSTRARLALRKALPLLDGAVVAIGNAPTALFELCDLVRRGACRPALVVGVPIGFVGAAESHEELTGIDCPWITVPGPKGGSPAAAAVVNAIIRLAAGPADLAEPSCTHQQERV
jgi:precorrin-8X/cobalt-precorrin-8 methylmutase